MSLLRSLGSDAEGVNNQLQKTLIYICCMETSKPPPRSSTPLNAGGLYQSQAL